MSYGIEVRNNSTGNVLIDEEYQQLMVEQLDTVTSDFVAPTPPIIFLEPDDAYWLGYYTPILAGQNQEIWAAPEDDDWQGTFRLHYFTKQAYDPENPPEDLNGDPVPDPYPGVAEGTPMFFIYNNVGPATFRTAVTRKAKDLSTNWVNDMAYGIDVFDSNGDYVYTSKSRPTKYVDWFTELMTFGVGPIAFSNVPSTYDQPLFVRGSKTFVDYVNGSFCYGYVVASPAYVWDGVNRTIEVIYANNNETAIINLDTRTTQVYAVASFGQFNWNNWG
jgi:hypothetical protein